MEAAETEKSRGLIAACGQTPPGVVPASLLPFYLGHSAILHRDGRSDGEGLIPCQGFDSTVSFQEAHLVTQHEPTSSLRAISALSPETVYQQSCHLLLSHWTEPVDAPKSHCLDACCWPHRESWIPLDPTFWRWSSTRQ